MEDWAYGLIIALCAVIWVHIFVDYRRKLMRVMPGVEEMAKRKKDFQTQISTSESNSIDIVRSIEDMRREIQELDEKRRDLQAEFNLRDMILVPAGHLNMGSNLAGKEEENPQHRVKIKSFYIDRYEVTNLLYKDFVDVAGHRPPVHWRNSNFPPGRANHPVVNVSWEDAQAYAEWVGKRLPTEAEWERAARGDEHREFPWGKQCTPDNANFSNPEGKTTPVDKYGVKGQSQFGVWDLCGNVGEWVNDWYEAKYYTRSPDADPRGPEDGQQKVYRGGGYQGNRMDIRAAARHYAMPNMYQEYIGFRCAMDAEE